MDTAEALADSPLASEFETDEFVFPPPALGEMPNPAIHDLSGLDPEVRQKMLVDALAEGVRQIRDGECVPFDFEEIMAELDAESR